jgi:cytochrome P450
VRSAEPGAGLPPSPPLPGALQTGLLWRWPFSFLSALRRRYGSRFTIHALARPPLVFLSDLFEAKEVFAAAPELLRPGEGGATIMPIVGERSFMLADGETHWRDVPFALHDRLRALTLRVILHTLFGDDVERVPELHGQLLSMLGVTAGVGLTLPASRSLPGGRASWQRFLADCTAVDAMFLHLVEARRARPAGHTDVLATLIAARDDDARPLATSYIRDSLMSLILAGHETTAAELAGPSSCSPTAFRTGSP